MSASQLDRTVTSIAGSSIGFVAIRSETSRVSPATASTAAVLDA